MKTIKLKRIISAALALIMMAGMFVALPVSAADPSYDLISDLTPGTMKFTESTESGYDFVATTEAYDNCAYYIDLAYLLKDFDIDKYLEEYETGYVVIYNDDYDARVQYSTNGGKSFSKEFPRKEIIGYDRYDDARYKEYYSEKLCEFSRDDKTAYEDLLAFGNVAIYTDVYEGPIVLTLKVTANELWSVFDSKIAYSKTIKITCDYILNAIKSVDIYDFDFTGKHNATLNTEAWSNVGNITSIKYLDENKKNERTSLVPGDKGYIEFTIAMIQHLYYVNYEGNPTWVTYNNGKKAHWHTTVQSHLKGSSYAGVETDSSSFLTFDDSKYLCKLYHYYEIPEETKYVIKQGTINITAPEDGATADKKVSTLNVKRVIIGKGNRTSPQFTTDDATWLTLSTSGRMKAVTSFSVGNTYIALVKLKPYGNFYFNSESAANIKVPGASKFTIAYMRKGDYDYINEDGYYLAATFPKVVSKTFYLQVGYDKSEVTANKNDTTYLTATASCDLSKATNVAIKWYYSADPSKDATGKLVSSVDAKLKYQLDTSAVGTGYYKCVISCVLGQKTAIVSYPDTEWVKLTVNEKPSSSTTSAALSLSPVGKQNADITEAYQPVDFEVKPSNESGEVRYNWYYCDASGNVTDKTPIGDGQALIIYGVEGKTGEKFYYKCVATDSKNTASLIFSCTIKYKDSDTETGKTDTDAPTTNGPDIDTVVSDTGADTSAFDTSNDDDLTEKNESSTNSTGDSDKTDTEEISANSTENSSESSTESSTESSAESSATDSSEKKESDSKLWLIILIIVIALGVGGGVVFVIVKKRKK